jgi:hypothetical protein
VPVDVRDRYETLKQNDLPAVAPRADAGESDEADDDDDDDGDDEGQTREPLSEQVSLGSFFGQRLL